MSKNGQTPADYAYDDAALALAAALRGGDVAALEQFALDTNAAVRVPFKGPSGEPIVVALGSEGRELAVRNAARAVGRLWQKHLEEWADRAKEALAAVNSKHMQNRDAALKTLSYLLPPDPQRRYGGEDCYHTSCLCTTTAPNLTLGGCERGSHLPLPVRALSIARACHRASTESPDNLAAALRIALPVAVEVEWLYRYLVFLCKVHSMEPLLGMHLLQTSGPGAVTVTRQARSARHARHMRNLALRWRQQRQQQRQQQLAPPTAHRHCSAGNSTIAAAPSMPVAVPATRFRTM